MTKRLQAHVVKLANHILDSFIDIIAYRIEELPHDYYSIMKRIVESSENRKKKQNNTKCSFFACNKVNKKIKRNESIKITDNYRIKETTIELRSILIDVVKHIGYIISTSEVFSNEFHLNKFFEILKNLDFEKLIKLYEKQNINKKLKNEVDKYASYFNISLIIEKQESKIKIYKSKIVNLEEARTANDCIICMENRRNLLFYPCLHFTCCNICGNSVTISNCPECQSKIESKNLITW